MKIEHLAQLPSNLDVLHLAVRGWNELLINGYADNGIMIAYDHQAIVAFDDEAPIGVLTWSDQPWFAALWVHLAYVLPRHRRNGVHGTMVKALVGKAQELGRPAIVSGTALDNVIARASIRSQGRREYAVMSRLVVPPAGH